MQLLRCPACSAPLPVSRENSSEITCPYCGSHIRLEQTPTQIQAQLIEQVRSTVVEQTAKEVDRRNMPLEHQMLELQLENLDTEERNLLRSPRSNIIKHQLRDVQASKRRVEAQMETIEKVIDPDRAAARALARQREARRTRMGRIAGTIAGLALILIIAFLAIAAVNTKLFGILPGIQTILPAVPFQFPPAGKTTSEDDALANGACSEMKKSGLNCTTAKLSANGSQRMLVFNLVTADDAQGRILAVAGASNVTYALNSNNNARIDIVIVYIGRTVDHPASVVTVSAANIRLWKMGQLSDAEYTKTWQIKDLQ